MKVAILAWAATLCLSLSLRAAETPEQANPPATAAPTVAAGYAKQQAIENETQEAVRLLGEKGEDAVAQAVDALAEGRVREWLIIQAVIENKLAKRFGSEAWSRVASERMTESPKGSIAGHFRNPTAVRALYHACELLEKTDGNHQHVHFGDTWEVFRYADPETALAAARAFCVITDDTAYVRSNCGYTLAGLSARAADPAYVAAMLVPIRTLARLSDMEDDFPVREIPSTLRAGAAPPYPLEVRLEAVAALRHHWPAVAGEAANRLTKPNLDEKAIAESQRILVESDSTGARVEAMLLLGAIGKTDEVRKNLEKMLAEAKDQWAAMTDSQREVAEDGQGDPEFAKLVLRRSNIAFALRLLKGGK